MSGMQNWNSAQSGAGSRLPAAQATAWAPSAPQAALTIPYHPHLGAAGVLQVLIVLASHRRRYCWRHCGLHGRGLRRLRCRLGGRALPLQEGGDQQGGGECLPLLKQRRQPALARRLPARQRHRAQLVQGLPRRRADRRHRATLAVHAVAGAG